MLGGVGKLVGNWLVVCGVGVGSGLDFGVYCV